MSSDPNANPGHHEPRAGPGHDPMKTVAGALRQASRTPGAGAERDGRDVVGHYGFLGQMAYRASYGLSFGLIYPVAKLARMMPKDNALIHGLHDGAAAARDEASSLWRAETPSLIDPLEIPTAPHPA